MKKARVVLWEEFRGEKQPLLLYDLWQSGVISEQEFDEERRKGHGDVFYMTLACFFLLYLGESF